MTAQGLCAGLETVRHAVKLAALGNRDDDVDDGPHPPKLENLVGRVKWRKVVLMIQFL